MKKNSFLKGAFIATAAIFVSKILGVLYVIPFYKIIGEENGALYGYAYQVYNLFFMLSVLGLPLAVSKIVSEYNELEYFNTKERVYKISRNFIVILGVLMFLILVIFAPVLARLINGDSGGFTIADITFVIRVISTAILIVPFISIARGYLQGHKYIDITGYSQVLEQIVRIIIILVGSYIAVNIFHLEAKYAIGIALFGATIGAIASWIYMALKIKKHRNELNKNEDIKEEEKSITDKEILKKLIMYALPFILVSFTLSIYELIEPVALNNILPIFKYTGEDINVIVASINMWGDKLNKIVSSIGVGIGVSLLPNITGSFVKKEKHELNNKINQTLQVVLYFTLPVTVYLSLLSKPVFGAFYGVTSKWGPLVFAFSIFIALASTFSYITTIMAQVLNKYKIIFMSLISGLVINIVLKVPLMYLVESTGLYGFIGAVISTLIGYFISTVINLIVIKKYMDINYKSTLKTSFKILYSTLIMLIVILLLKIVIPDSTSRLMNILICALYGVISFGVYAVITYFNKTIRDMFGDNFFKKMFGKLKKSR